MTARKKRENACRLLQFYLEAGFSLERALKVHTQMHLSSQKKGQGYLDGWPEARSCHMHGQLEIDDRPTHALEENFLIKIE